MYLIISSNNQKIIIKNLFFASNPLVTVTRSSLFLYKRYLKHEKTIFGNAVIVFLRHCSHRVLLPIWCLQYRIPFVHVIWKGIYINNGQIFQVSEGGWHILCLRRHSTPSNSKLCFLVSNWSTEKWGGSITQNGNIGVVTSYYWDRFLQLLSFTEKKTQKVGQMLWNFTTKIAPRNWCTYLFVSLLLTTISMRRGSSNLPGELDLAFFSALGTCVVLIRL